MIGLFAVTEMLVQIGEPPWIKADAADAALKLPDLKMMKRLAKPTAIGSVIGTFEGVTPGAGGTIAAFMAYPKQSAGRTRRRNSARDRPKALPAPECANNVVTATALVPLLSLGIPDRTRPPCCWRIPRARPAARADAVREGAGGRLRLYGGLLVANIIDGAARPRDPHAVHLARQSSQAVADCFVLALVVTGVYSVHQSVFEVGLVLGFGVLGYILRSCKVPPLPMVLGVVLGFMIESNYRRSLLLTGGDHASSTRTRCPSGCVTLAACSRCIRCGASWDGAGPPQRLAIAA
jgi:putative tricarboxylic transport membrane protein